MGEAFPQVWDKGAHIQCRNRAPDESNCFVSHSVQSVLPASQVDDT